MPVDEFGESSARRRRPRRRSSQCATVNRKRFPLASIEVGGVAIEPMSATIVESIAADGANAILASRYLVSSDCC